MKKLSKKYSHLTTRTKKQLDKLKRKSQTNLAKIDSLSDSDIDYSDIPELEDNFWVNAKVVEHAKKPISIRIDLDVLTWFKEQKNIKYQKLINAVLRHYMNAHRRYAKAQRKRLHGSVEQ